jgi:hypothetical protein
VSVGFSFSAAFVPLEIVLLIYNAAKFKVVSSGFQEMDELISSVDHPSKTENNIPQRMKKLGDEIMPESIISEKSRNLRK